MLNKIRMNNVNVKNVQRSVTFVSTTYFQFLLEYKIGNAVILI
jgi:hypothetical protein